VVAGTVGRGPVVVGTGRFTVVDVVLDVVLEVVLASGRT
jgi:hypothetical protein